MLGGDIERPSSDGTLVEGNRGNELALKKEPQRARFKKRQLLK